VCNEVFFCPKTNGNFLDAAAQITRFIDLVDDLGTNKQLLLVTGGNMQLFGQMVLSAVPTSKGLMIYSRMHMK